MPRAKKKEVVVQADPRDFVMARLAAGRAAAQSAINAIDDAMNLFVNPEDDKGGNERIADIEEALEALGVACRAVEAVEESIEDVDMSEGEPWDDEDEDDEED